MVLALALPGTVADAATWSEREVRILESLQLPSPPLAPPSPSNRVADNVNAAAFGRQLFFDPRFSANGEIACASCHQPARHFTDNRAQAKGLGEINRNTPTIVGVGNASWFYWDGRRDSLWAQALTPFESSAEMGISRVGVLRRIAADSSYRRTYESLFGALPRALQTSQLPAEAGPIGDSAMRTAWQQLPGPAARSISRAFANVGKAIAAFERTLHPAPSRFDRQVAALLANQDTAQGILSEDEIAGARLFIDSQRTQCLRCHNGPHFSNGGFHNIGTGSFQGTQLDFGRVYGLRAVQLDEFNCIGRFSDARPEQCLQLRFLNRSSHVPLEGAYKVPGLRNLRHTAPYMHDGRFTSLTEVIAFYRNPPLGTGSHELQPLDISDKQAHQLEAFLLTLTSEP